MELFQISSKIYRKNCILQTSIFKWFCSAEKTTPTRPTAFLTKNNVVNIKQVVQKHYQH